MMLKMDFFSNSALCLDDVPVKIPFAKAEGLLYCLIAGKSMSKETLTGLFWGDCSEDLAKKSLRNAIYTLRKLLGEQVISTERKGYLQLGGAYGLASDLNLLQEDYRPGSREEIAALLQMYQQDFLSHFTIKNAPDFADWLFYQQEAYRKAYLKKLEQCMEAAGVADDPDLVEECLRKLISLDSYEERYYLQLFRLLVAQNKLSECMKLYNRLEKILKEELAIQPSAEIAALLEKSLKEQMISGSHYDLFYGRKRELAELTQNYLSFMKNEPYASYVFWGEAGVGKTQLIYNFVDALHGGFLLFDISNYRIEKDFSYKLWDTVFEHIVYMMEQGRVQVPAAMIQAIHNVFPYFSPGEGANTSRTGLHSESQAEKYIVQLIEHISRQHKVMIVIDDLQWVDAHSIDLLIQVMRRCDNLLVLATLRDDFTELWEYLAAGLRSKGNLKRVSLPRFDVQETQEFVALLVPELAAHGESIYRESEGNPFFITEMLNNYRAGMDIEQLSQKMNDFIGGRLATLSNAARSIVNICAAIQGDISLELLSRISGIRNIELVEILEELLNIKVLKEFHNIQGEVEFFFTHQKIREYIYNHISLAKREIIHGKIGEGMEAIFVEEKRSHTYYPRLIYHYTIAGNIYKVLKYRLSHLEILIKARHEMFPANLDINNVSIASYLDPQKDTNEEFYELAGLLRDPRLHCSQEELAQLNISYSFLFGRYNAEYGDVELGNKSLQRALELAKASRLNEPLAAAYVLLIQHYLDVYDLPSMERMIAEALQVPYIQRHPVLAAYLLRYRGYMQICQGDYSQGEASVEQAIEMLDIQQEGAFSLLASAFFSLGESRLRQGDYATAENRLLAAKRYCPSNLLHSGQAVINLELGMVYYRQGNDEKALQSLLQSHRYYEQSIFMWYRALLYCYLAKTSNRLGQLPQAQEYARHCLDVSPRYPNRHEWTEIEQMCKELQAQGLDICPTIK